MKILKYVVIILSLFFSVKNIYAYSFDNTQKVYDYALVLKDKQINTLKDKINKYISENNIDMVAVTVRHYNHEKLSDYTKEFYNKNKFGLDNSKSGIIIVIDVKNNSIDIQTFGKAIELYNTYEINNIISKINKDTKYYNKLSNFIKYSNIYSTKDKTYLKNDDLISINWFFIILVSTLFPTLIVIILLLKIKDTSNDDLYLGENKVVITKKSEEFVTTNTKQIYK